MGETTIEWTATCNEDGTVSPGYTFNPWIGCTKVSAGCTNCYAENLMDKRYGRVQWGGQGRRVRTSKTYWRKPLAWNRQAEAEGRRYRVFCASLADVFEDKPDQPEMADWRGDLWSLICDTPNLDWLLLTKRPENVMRMAGYLYKNIWIGTSVENQEQANIRIPELLEIPARVRFLSCEPLLGAIDLFNISVDEGERTMEIDCLRGQYGEFARPQADCEKVHWVIVGGESGAKARACYRNWVEDIVKQCQAAGVPVFVKQMGSNAVGFGGLKAKKGEDMSEWPHILRIREFPQVEGQHA